jgi:hypothetical protein
MGRRHRPTSVRTRPKRASSRARWPVATPVMSVDHERSQPMSRSLCARAKPAERANPRPPAGCR